MNLHIMLTSGIHPAGAPLFSSLNSLPGNSPGESGSEDGEEFTQSSPRWFQPVALSGRDPLPMREVEQGSDFDHESIANLAYLFYLQDGSPEGKDKEHWAQAELFLSNLAS